MTFKFSSLSGWNGWLTTMIIDIVDQMAAVITPVSQHMTSFYIYLFQQWNGACDIISLSLTDHQTDRITV